MQFTSYTPSSRRFVPNLKTLVLMQVYYDLVKDFYFIHKLKLILFLQDQIQLDICYFPMVAIPSITFLGNSTPPWYVTINNSMYCVWRIYFLSTDQMHNKALWTSFLFKNGIWCVSFTCLSFCSCKTTSQTVEEKTLTNKFSLVLFLFLYFAFLL